MQYWVVHAHNSLPTRDIMCIRSSRYNCYKNFKLKQRITSTWTGCCDRTAEPEYCCCNVDKQLTLISLWNCGTKAAEESFTRSLKNIYDHWRSTTRKSCPKYEHILAKGHQLDYRSVCGTHSDAHQTCFRLTRHSFSIQENETENGASKGHWLPHQQIRNHATVNLLQWLNLQ